MKKTEEGFERSNKENLIIEVAQMRFGIYGVEKTSMQEIANDLKLSKASLYYYFPDKASLYKAVVEKEQTEFINKILERILRIKEPEQLLREYVNARLSYFRTLLNLSRLRLEAYSDLKPVFRETIKAFKEKEKEIVKNIFEKGIALGKFSIKDTDQTASLFLDLLKGLRISIVNDKKMLIIDQEEYDQLLKNTIDFTNIFLNGLKIK
ncbi:MAG: TetR/AcrR family transcriptional regulator [Bacteroidetes bacterium]|nr:MAG: TetR/AcrR family transcriptional regulator [Bacteroidota bacterium]